MMRCLPCVPLCRPAYFSTCIYLYIYSCPQPPQVYLLMLVSMLVSTHTSDPT